MLRSVVVTLASLAASQASADAHSETQAVITACAGIDGGFDAAVDTLRSSGWVTADVIATNHLANAMAVQETLFDGLDKDAASAVKVHSDRAASFRDTIQASIDKIDPPFDAMTIEILKSPSGVVAEVSWNKISSGDYNKVYFSCRIAPLAGANRDAIGDTIEARFNDPYLERSDKSGALGLRSNWTNYDNLNLYLDTLASGLIAEETTTLIQTIVSAEG